PETPQDHALATIAPKIEKREGEIRFEDSARTIYDKFRAFDPWPGVSYDGVKFTEIRVAAGSQPAGTILEIGDGVVVACGEGAIRILEMQRPGKPRAAAADV